MKADEIWTPNRQSPSIITETEMHSNIQEQLELSEFEIRDMAVGTSVNSELESSQPE